MKKTVVVTNRLIKLGVSKISDLLNNKFSNTSESPVFVSILQGGNIFCHDLMSSVDFKYAYDSIEVKSYKEQQQGELKLIKQPTFNLSNKKIILVDDFFDSGKTMFYVINYLKEHYENIKITPVTFLKRQSKIELEGLIYCYLIQDESWLYGYGLDLDGEYRDKREIFKLEK